VVDFTAAGRGIGQRFQVVSVIPTFVVLGGIWFVTATGAWSAAPDLGQAFRRLGEITIGGAATAALIVITVSLITHPFQQLLVKVLEGYVAWGHPISRYGLARHTRRLYMLRAARDQLGRSLEPSSQVCDGASGFVWIHQRLDALRRQVAEYPTEDRLLPTRLGNTLRRAEDVAGDRYGIAAVSFFPYLYATMPTHFTAQIRDARNEMDTAARFCPAFLTLSAVTLVAFADDRWWLTIPVVLYGLAWLSYLATVTAAASFGRHVARAIDLYRFTVLDALSLPRPVSRAEERRIFQELRELVDSQPEGPTKVLYTHNTRR
jgi:hypothetical protein